MGRGDPTPLGGRTWQKDSRELCTAETAGCEGQLAHQATIKMPYSKIPPLCECEVTLQWKAPPRRSSSSGPSPCGCIDPDEVEALQMM
ncbi:hypothetical protein FKM82_023651 [Ascaphus truei]